jgi:hypothetical protein
VDTKETKKKEKEHLLGWMVKSSKELFMVVNLMVKELLLLLMELQFMVCGSMENSIKTL